MRMGNLQFPYLHITVNKKKKLAVFPAEMESCDCTVYSELES